MQVVKAPDPRLKVQTKAVKKITPALLQTIKEMIKLTKTFKDPEFAREYKKLTGEDATPLLPEDNERAIRDIPRDSEVIEIFKKLIGAGPLPPR